MADSRTRPSRGDLNRWGTEPLGCSGAAHLRAARVGAALAHVVVLQPAAPHGPRLVLHVGAGPRARVDVAAAPVKRSARFGFGSYTALADHSRFVLQRFLGKSVVFTEAGPSLPDRQCEHK